MDPNPIVRGADPRIQIRTKMSRIRNTVYKLRRIPVSDKDCQGIVFLADQANYDYACLAIKIYNTYP